MERSLYTDMWQTLDQKKAYQAIITNKSKQGEWYTCPLHITPILDAEGIPQYYLGVTPQKEDMSSFQSSFFHTWEDPQVWGKKQQDWIADMCGVDHAQTYSSAVEALADQWVAPVQQKFQDRYNDQILIARAKKNPSEFRLLYHKYYDMVVAYLGQKIFDKDLIEELTQDTFLQAFRYLSSFTYSHASYRTYLYRIAHSRYVSFLRKKKEHISLDQTAPPTITDNTIDDLLLGALLEKAQPVLSNAEYQVCVSFYVNQESVRNISIAMGRSCNAVKLLLSRARKKLKAEEVIRGMR